MPVMGGVLPVCFRATIRKNRTIAQCRDEPGVIRPCSAARVKNAIIWPMAVCSRTGDMGPEVLVANPVIGAPWSLCQAEAVMALPPAGRRCHLWIPPTPVLVCSGQLDKGADIVDSFISLTHAQKNLLGHALVPQLYGVHIKALRIFLHLPTR